MKKTVLFIGNSYTHYHNMPEKIFVQKAADLGHLFSVTAVTHDGYRLSRFADPTDTEGQRLRNVIKNHHYDYVVLQDQSCNPVVDESNFLKGVAAMQTLLAECAERFILYATWGRKSGSAKLEELGMTNEEMTEKLADIYERAGMYYGMKVAHVGKAFALYQAMHPDAELYEPDRSHPSEKGSEIAAQTILNAILASNESD